MPPAWAARARQPPPEEGEDPVTVLVTGFGVSCFILAILLIVNLLLVPNEDPKLVDYLSLTPCRRLVSKEIVGHP
jgi:hypothetical protein